MNTYRIKYAYTNTDTGYRSFPLLRDVKSDNINSAIEYFYVLLTDIISELNIFIDLEILEIRKIENEE